MEKVTGIKIKELRKSKGLTQLEFAKKINISNATLSQYESGDVNIPSQKLIEIANILETTPNYLLGNEDIMYTTDRENLINNCLKTTNTLNIAVENDIDKVDNLFAPILKNTLNDIVILDIDGKSYLETVRHRKKIHNELIIPINFSKTIYKKFFNEENFNPLYYITLKNSKETIKNIAYNFLNIYEDNDKTDFLISVIAHFFFKNRLEEKNRKTNLDKIEKTYYEKNNQLSLVTLFDFLNKMGTKKSMVEEFKIINNTEYMDNFKNYLDDVKLKRIEEIKQNGGLKIKNMKNIEDYFKEMNFCTDDIRLFLELGIVWDGIDRENGDLIDEEKYQLVLEGFIPDYYYKTQKLIKLGNEKLLEIKEDLLKNDFSILDYKKQKNSSLYHNLKYNDKDYFSLLNDISYFDLGKVLAGDISFKGFENPNIIKTFYFIVDKEDFDLLKPIIRVFIYLLFENVKDNYLLSDIKKSPDCKNLIVIIDEYSKLGLNTDNTKYKGIKKILVSDLKDINENYFKYEDENMKIADNKMEIIFQKEKLGFFKDVAPISKSRKVTNIEDELKKLSYRKEK